MFATVSWGCQSVEMVPTNLIDAATRVIKNIDDTLGFQSYCFSESREKKIKTRCGLDILRKMWLSRLLKRRFPYLQAKIDILIKLYYKLKNYLRNNFLCLKWARKKQGAFIMFQIQRNLFYYCRSFNKLNRSSERPVTPERLLDISQIETQVGELTSNIIE